MFRLLIFLSILLTPVLSFAQPDENEEQKPSTEEQLAGQFYTNGEWQKAADLYEKLYEKIPANFYYSQLLNCYVNLKDTKAAEKLVSRQIRKNPTQLKYVIDLAFVYQSAGDDDKARKQYEKALKELDPADDRQVFDLSSAYQARGQTDLAIKTFVDARRQVPRAYNFNIELASLYSKKGETAKVLDEYSELLNMRGGVYIEQVQQSLQDIMATDESGEKTELIREHLLKEAQRNPDNLVFSDLLIWMFVQKKDFESALIQSKALDKRLKENGSRVFDLARICVSNDQFETGKKAYQYVIEKQPISPLYLPAKKELSMAIYRKLTTSASYTPAELTELHSLLEQTYTELGAGEQSYDLAIRLAHIKGFYLGQAKEGFDLLAPLTEAKSGLALRPVNEVKLEMGDLQLLMGDVWESTLTYSQIEKSMKTDTLGQEAKFRNARLAYYKGEFDWAKAQLDVLKAATSKLIANDALELSLLIGDNTAFDSTGDALRMFARADLWFYQNKTDASLATLDSLQTQFPESTLQDDILFRKGKIAMRRGDFQGAIVAFEKVLASYRSDILADNSLFLLGSIYDSQLKDSAKAMTIYQELMTDFPGSMFVVEARKRFRTLRGDAVQ